jgi:NAD(P)-dependent dehydrogenase (short-subunit alcohol dehydrogenase family)
MEIQGKTALITGGAKRVGRAIALALAGKGAHILLHYRSSEKEAQNTASEIETLGGRCELFRADLTKSSDIQKMLSAIEKRPASVDILVNSASLYFKTPVNSVREEEWDRLIDANLKAPFLLSVEIGRRMSKRSGGKIINIADWSGFRPYKDYIAYCTSKGGLITMTKSLARDFAPKIQANAVAPGPVLPPSGMDDAEKAAIAKTTALGRWGKPEDVAAAVIFLVENDFVNGIVLVVDGGRSIV